MKHKNIRFVLLVLLIAAVIYLKAAEPPPVPSLKDKLVLLGSATKRFLTFRVVSVDLYIGEGHAATDILKNIPKRIEVNYHVNIPKAELERATTQGIQKNVSKEEFLALSPQIRQINSYYSDVSSKDQIAVTYIPGSGSQVEVNNKIKGTVPGEAFGRAFFAIWIGEKPVDSKARLKLLGEITEEK